ncbi:MAG TPA: NeuD/PglB/VioB family sugar acetyltransferase [Gemmataceae bacterium]|jgi:sugar O-acyltransferase (sialic acid O-acetyltransferase NeuD family)|nr:NeuD/PglB/VioB family sugar acetyltransferase [Gemmataceae bacterium]
MLQPLIILGTGGNAYDFLDVVEAINARQEAWTVAGFLDDAAAAGSSFAGLPVLGRLRDAGQFADHYFINAIGSDKSYRRRPDILASTGIDIERFATLVHPGASVSSRARLGHGVCVNHGVTIAGAVVVGNHVTLCPGCILGHDAAIEHYAVIAPGAVISGFVRVGRSCYIGAGSVIRQRLRIGAGALVGMGAVVVRDVEDGVTVIGNPARVHSSLSSAVDRLLVRARD